MKLLKMDMLRPDRPSEKSWVFKGDSIKYTSNPQIIDQELKELQDNRTVIEIMATGYHSSPSLLIGHDHESLELDKPVNWAGLNGHFYIQYRFPGYPFSYIRTEFLREDASSVYCSYPTLLIVFEQRQFFRISVPVDSNIVIPRRSPAGGAPVDRRKKKGVHASRYTGYIKDISLGGVCFLLETRRYPRPPGLHARIGPLKLLLKGVSTWTGDEFEVEEGEVVRSKEISIDGRYYWEVALKFVLKGTSESKLYQYIRQREIELAKLQ